MNLSQMKSRQEHSNLTRQWEVGDIHSEKEHPQDTLVNISLDWWSELECYDEAIVDKKCILYGEYVLEYYEVFNVYWMSRNYFFKCFMYSKYLKIS